MRQIRSSSATAFLSLLFFTITNLEAQKMASEINAPDLNPVTFHAAPVHTPLVLVRDGEPQAQIAVLGEANQALRQALEELKLSIALTTGAELEIINSEPAGRMAIVVGDCPAAVDIGLDSTSMPEEGFAIKTAEDAVYIVGRDEGQVWGVIEFIERFVGVRWYWPANRGGRSLRPRSELVIPPVHLTDAPVFRKRHDYPPVGNGPDGTRQDLRHQYLMLRNADTWPVSIRVHQPGKAWEYYRESRPEIFALRSDGTRHSQMYCYSHPRTLATFIEEIAAHYAGRELPTFRKDSGATFIFKDSISVSPPDVAPSCHCAACQKLWYPEGGQYGAASYVLADFVKRLATAVKMRWPDKTIIYLPYQNYTEAPDGVEFPGNVEVQICGMPGIAQYKEPGIAAWEQEQLHKWHTITGRRVQNWHYSCWPADRIRAPYQYPHVLQEYYRKNRDILVGTFINGTKDHWPRHHISLYAWHKLLWNPDYNVEAGIMEYCRRMYGPAAASVGELIRLLIDGWQESRWPDGILTPMAVYEHAYPQETMSRIEALLAQAQAAVAGNAELQQRLDYFMLPFGAFFKEQRLIVHGEGIRPLIIMRADEEPVLDGRLEEPAWERAIPGKLVVHKAPHGEREAEFPSTVRAVWTPEALFLALHLAEPETDGLVRDIQARDDSMMWHQDCIEIFLDVTGANSNNVYQLIINAAGAVWDAAPGGRDGRGGDAAAWDLEDIKIGIQIADDHWTMEVRLPISGFEGVMQPGTGVSWFGQITRHRNGRGKQTGSGENQKLNAVFGGRNGNIADFAPFQFVE